MIIKGNWLQSEDSLKQKAQAFLYTDSRILNTSKIAIIKIASSHLDSIMQNE